MIVSTTALVRPYTDSGWMGEVSLMGILGGVPYTVAEDENTSDLAPCRSIAWT